jgi:hypothetical protein
VESEREGELHRKGKVKRKREEERVEDQMEQRGEEDMLEVYAGHSKGRRRIEKENSTPKE